MLSQGRRLMQNRRIWIWQMFFVLLITRSGMTQSWSDPVTIVPDYGDTPDLAIDRNTGRLYVTVMRDGVTLVVLSPYGEVLEQEIVPGTSFEKGRYNFGAAVAVDSRGYPHIAFRKVVGDVTYDLFYTYKSESGWSMPIQIDSYVERGYQVKLAVDKHDRVYYCYSDTYDGEILGPIHYLIFEQGSEVFRQDDIYEIRGDALYEMDCNNEGIVELVSTTNAYPSGGGPVYYWRSDSTGTALKYQGDIHTVDSRGGANGFADMFIDASNHTHVCYGNEYSYHLDNPSEFRYIRLENGVKQFETRISDRGEIANWKLGMAIGSIAASADGRQVVGAYLQSLDGELRSRLSQDGGHTWEDYQTIYEDGWDCCEGRNRHIIRAYESSFYLVYPLKYGGVAMRMLQLAPMTGKISGTVSYFSTGSGIPDVSIQVTGDTNLVTATDALGDFVHSLYKYGDYSLIASRDGKDTSAVNSYDAALAARFSLGMTALDSMHAVAADVNRDDRVNLYDAGLILRYAVQFDNWKGARVGHWAFVPPERHYQHLNQNYPDQNFSALILGDVDGSWVTDHTLMRAQRAYIHPVQVETKADRVKATVILEDESGVQSGDVVIRFDESIMEYQTCHLTHADDRAVYQVNGLLRIAFYSLCEVQRDTLTIWFSRKSRNIHDRSFEVKSIRVNNRKSWCVDIVYHDGESVMVKKFEMIQNYPNPFNPGTVITYHLSRATDVSIDIFNMLGQHVKTVVKEFQNAGSHTVVWDGTDFANTQVAGGRYLCRLFYGGQHSSIILVKQQ